jgi:hypothetical protein
MGSSDAPSAPTSDETREVVEQAVSHEESAMLDQVIEHLVEHWGNERPCPYCGNGVWDIGPVVEFPLFFSDGIIAVVTITCQRCAHVVLLNAMTGKLLPPVAAKVIDAEVLADE